MLPNKMKITERATSSLRRLQSNTGITVNVSARLAFFTSIAGNYSYYPEAELQLDGRELEKHSWLGDYADVVEMLLVNKYPTYSDKERYRAWASHVDDGSLIIEAKSSLLELASII